MSKNQKNHEKFLQEIWKEQNFGSNLLTKDGQQIEVIDAGIENKEFGGPDFKNARIKIGNITYNGDVEIDSYYTDWRAHGHSIDKKYNKVILHAVLNNETKKSYVFTQDGRKVQSISLDHFLKEDLKGAIRKAIVSDRKNRINKMRCLEANALLSDKEKLDLIYELGKQRFIKKGEKMLERLKEITYLKELNLKEPVIRYDLDENFMNRKFTHEDFNDTQLWEQLIYESIFEALGYSKNKEIMQKLAVAADLSLLKKYKDKEEFKLYLESALFNISGLMPEVDNLPDEEVSAYTRKLAETWQEIKSDYDGKTFHATQWHFFKLRPQNFPTIRIAGGAIILYRMLKNGMIAKLLKDFENIANLKKLANDLRSLIIVKGEGFWRNHYVFDQPANNKINYFIGLSRADEILVNVLLPIVSVYFEIFGKKELAHKVQQLYLNYYQKSENNLVNEVSTTLSLNDAWKRSVLYQGMIELFRNFCSKGKCLECEIGKRAFN